MQDQGYSLPIRGGCFCQKVRYEINQNPIREGVCHCHSCQRLTGGGCWAFLVVKIPAFKFEGQVKEISRSGGSGKEIIARFCPSCGSTLFAQPLLWPKIFTVSASTLDEKQFFKPQMHVWTKEAPSWMCFSPEFECFSENPPPKKLESIKTMPA